MATVIFYICAVAVLVGALGVVLAHNPVHSALFLLLTLVSVAILFLQQDAALVAIIQIVVYASATPPTTAITSSTAVISNAQM